MENHSTPVKIFADDLSLGEALAQTIADRIQVCLGKGNQFILGCPGGRTPVTTFNALASELERREVDLRKLVIAMMDDYVVEDGNGWRAVDENAHNSCRRFAREEIQSVLNRGIPKEHRIPDENVWLPDASNPELYDAKLSGSGGVNFFILASGASDGHVAFNPPGSSSQTRTRVVELAELTRRDNLSTFSDFAGIDEVPSHGVTVGIATIVEQSHEAAMILVGADKQLAFKRLTASNSFDSLWPATVVKLVGNAQIYADAVASTLSPDSR
jgi:glucosamine-6-phosphate deaminase